MLSYLAKETPFNRLAICLASLLTLFFFTILIFVNFSSVGEQQFSYLAASFLHGKLYFLEEPGSWIDTAPFWSNYYWPLGPLPAIILIPFVFLFSLAGKLFLQGYLQPLLVATVFYIVYRFGRLLNYSPGDAIFWAFGFTFATVFMNVALMPWSWWYAQVVAVLLTWAGLWEYFNKKRFWLLGVITGALFLTRSTAGLLGVLFVLEVFAPKVAPSTRHKLKCLLQYSVPIAIFLLLGWIYNYLRFGDFFEQGYSLQIVINESMAKARDYGLVSIKHVPGNLYYFLISMPLPVFRDETSHVLRFPFIVANPWGMSIFTTSPFFILLILIRYKLRSSKLLLLTAFFIALPIMLYYGNGFRQSGYRYSLDFLPLLYLVLMKEYRESQNAISLRLKTIFIATSFSNLYFLYSLFVPA